jgi:hypothetical protein
MANKKILDHLLIPRHTGNKKIDSDNIVKWNEFLEIVDENISWYPSSGNDFRDILFLNNPVFNHIGIIPSVYIHTDISFAYDLIFNPQVQEFVGITININNVIELQTNVNLICDGNNLTQPAPGGIKHLTGRELSGNEEKRYLQKREFENNSSRVYLLNVSIEFNGIWYKNKNVLYFIFENYCFFERFIIEQNLELLLIFCHCSQSFKAEELNNLSNDLDAIDYLISNGGIFVDLEEFQNEIIDINANFSLHCIDILKSLPFEGIMKTFQIVRH